MSLIPICNLKEKLQAYVSTCALVLSNFITTFDLPHVPAWAFAQNQHIFIPLSYLHNLSILYVFK